MTCVELKPMLQAILGDPGRCGCYCWPGPLVKRWDWLIEEPAPAVGRLLTAAEPIQLTEPITIAASDTDLVRQREASMLAASALGRHHALLCDELWTRAGQQNCGNPGIQGQPGG